MMCVRCTAREVYTPTMWFSHIWRMYRMQRGKYPYEPDDLSEDEWMALGEMDDALEAVKAEGFK